MNYNILGSMTPMLNLVLEQGESVYAQTGAMQWMDPNVEMQTEMKGGLMGGLKRSISGENMFIVNFNSKVNNGYVAFGHTYPGRILPINVAEKPIICQQRSFLCAEQTVKYDVWLQRKLGAGFFGGEGFILQKLHGQGTAFIEIDGDNVEMELAQGQQIKVDTGSVGAFEETVSMDIQMVKGFRNMLVGGEGMFLTTLTGPGKVWIQTMPVQCMVGELSKYMPKK